MKENEKFEKAFDKAKTLLNWSKIFLSCLGLWPQENKFLFLPMYYYFMYHFSKDFIAFYLTLSSHNLMKVIGTGLECLSITQVWVRFWTLKKYNKDLVTLLKDFEKDYSIKNYSTTEQKNIFLKYNSTSKKILMTSMSAFFFTIVLYFFQPLLQQMSEIST